MTDERTINAPVSVNEEIQDRTIRHMVFLERYKAGEVRRIRKILDTQIIPNINAKIEKRLLRIIERGSDLGPSTTRRLKQLEKELLKLSREMSTDLRKVLTVDLTDLSRDEMAWQVNVIKDGIGFDLELVVPDPRTVAKVIKRTSFAGQTLDQWFDSLARATQRNIMTAVNRGIVEGETTAQIMQRIRGTRAQGFTDGVWATTRRQAEAVTRTTINHATNQARLELFKENEDIIEGLQWTATLDARTSTICAGLDGQVFKIDKGPRPPAHVNCRSVMSVLLKSAASLGLNELPAGKRASMDGQVPATLTYGQWLKKQPSHIQIEVLGSTKAKLFTDGKLPIERFTNDNLKPLTLDQLRIAEENAFTKAGL